MHLNRDKEPDADEIRAQLMRVLSSPDFQISQRLKDFLSFVVEETLAGNGSNIKAYTIAVAAFGRGNDFNPQLDPIVRIEAGKLRKALELYFFNHPQDSVQIHIPKGGYVPVFRRPRPPGSADGHLQIYNYALQSERGEYGPEDKKHFQGLPETSPAYPLPPNTDFSALSASYRGAELEQEERPFMMVLPFSLREGAEHWRSFLYGLTSDLFAHIQNNEIVHVRESPLTDVDAINRMNIIRFAREEGVRFVLHGEAQPAGTGACLYVSLTDAKKGLRLWTGKYDCPSEVSDWVEAQAQITQDIFFSLLDIVGLISRTLTQETSYLPINELNVYESTLLYVRWVTTFDRESYPCVRQALELNLTKDPHNPVLFSQISDIYSSDYQFAFNTIPGNLDRALELVKRSLSLDPSYHMAYLSKSLYFFLTGNRRQLKFTLDELAGRPDITPFARASIGLYTGLALDLEEGREIIAQAVRLNPYQPSCYNVVPFLYHFKAGEYDEALRHALLINAPSCVWEPLILSAAHVRAGQNAEAEKAVRRLLALEPQFNSKRKQILFGLFFDEENVKMIDCALQAAGV